MTFSYLIKTNKSKTKLMKSKKSIHIDGLTSIYFSSKENKNLSKKESFYQYLFIHSILEDKIHKFTPNESKNFTHLTSKFGQKAKNESEWKNISFKDSLSLKELLDKNYDELIDSNQKSNILSYLIKSNSYKSNLFGNNHSLNIFSQDKIFINYKKSFLSYWLLPLLGLVGSINPNLNSQLWNSSSINGVHIHLNRDMNFKRVLSKDLINSNYLDQLSRGRSITETNKLFIYDSKKTSLNQNQHYDQYSKSLMLMALKYFQQSNKIESLLLERNIKHLSLDFNFKTFNFNLFEKNLQNRSSLNWTWFDLSIPSNSNNEAEKYIESSVFPDKISNIGSILPSPQTHEKLKFEKMLSTGSETFLKSNLKNLNTLKSKGFNQNNMINNQQNIFKINPIKLLINKNKDQILFEWDSNSTENYFVGIINNPNSKMSKMSKNKTINNFKNLNSPSNSINKSDFLMDQLHGSQTSLFHSIFSLSDLFKSSNPLLNMETNNLSIPSTIDLNSNRKKALLLILKNKSDVIHSSKQLSNSDSSSNFINKKMIWAINSDSLYDCIFDGLGDTLNLILDSKTRLEKLNNKKLFENQKSNNKKLFEDSIKNYRSLSKQNVKNSKDSILIQNKSIYTGNYPLSDQEMKFSFNISNNKSQKTLIVQEPLIKTGITQTKPLLSTSKKFNQVKIMGSESIKTRQQNSFLVTSNSIAKMSYEIKKALNPYKFRLSYLPQMNVYSFEDVNKMKLRKYNSKTYFEKGQNQNYSKKGLNFEKVFLAYLSKSKKLSYSLKPREMKFLGSFKNELKFKTRQKLKSLNRQYLKSNGFNKKIKFNNRNKNNSNLMILKNRLFLNKINNSTDVSIKNIKNIKNEKNENGLYHKDYDAKKRQELKIKRRLKKMKCETRRRKKRKIFYPRPNWIVFSLYKKFLDSRYSFNSLKSNRIKNRTPQKLNFSKSNSNEIFKKMTKTVNQKDGFKTNPLTQTYSHWLVNKSYGLNSESFQKKLILKNSNDFYITSQTVLTDLRRVLMKSNWLRSYLNPYLDKVKAIYGELQKSSKKMYIYNNLQTFLAFIYGSPINLSENTYLNVKNLSLAESQIDPFHTISLNFKNCVDESTMAMILFEKNHKLSDLNNQKNLQLQKNLMGSSKTKINVRQKGVDLTREERLNILEYNRILYQRIQRAILNIRENLNLNGEIKNRSKKLPKNIRPFIKRDYIKREMINGVPTNQNSDFWSKVFKNNIFKFGRSFVSYGYDEETSYNNTSQLLSRNNFYWALNKTGTFTTPNFNSSYTKKLWESSKVREISKSNKTKKIVFNLFMKYANLFNSTRSLDGYDHILEIFKDDPNFINSKQFEDSKLTRFFYKKSISPQNPILSYTNYSIEDEIHQAVFNLSPTIYTTKTEQKLINIENKLKLLGLYSKKVEQNSKNTYFRFLKQELLKEKKFYNLKTNKDKSISSHTFTDIFMKLKQKSLNPMSENNFFKNNFSMSANKNKMAINNSYWWTPLNAQIDYLDYFDQRSNESFQNHLKTGNLNNPTFQNQNPGFIHLSTFLFHFCALISFISLGGVRTLLKFCYILTSKISKGIKSVEKISNVLPKSNSKNNYKTESFENLDYSDDLPKKFQSREIQIMQSNFGKIIRSKQMKRSKLLSSNQTTILQNLKIYFFQYLITRGAKSTDSSFGLNFQSLFENQKLESNMNSSYELNLKLKNQFFISKSLTSEQTNSVSTFFKSNKMKYNEMKHLEFNLKHFNKLVQFILNDSNNLNQNTTKLDLRFDNPAFIKNKLRFQYSSLVKASIMTRFMYRFSFYGYLILLRSVDLLSIPASFIYKFFEKPGEYVVENLAYSFLVEWSSDISSTIPDTLDTSSALYVGKLNRMITSLVVFNNNSVLNSLNRSFSNNSILNINLLLQNSFIATLTNAMIKRILNSSFLIFVQQLCEPDLDYINRQKKARSIWDIWGEHLKTIAEENSINIYELTTDKDEQIKLLSKYQDNLLELDKTHSNYLLDMNPTYYLSFKHSLYALKPQKNLKIQNVVSQKTNSLESTEIQSRIKKMLELSMNKIFPKINNSTQIQNFNLKGDVSSRSKSNYNYYAWSVNQFLSYQGKDSDLFIDLHPPKALSSSVAALKYSFCVQQPVGSIVCQIFSGIFYKQISKNILVVGSEGLEKTLLIQAIAGETELKMITDSAHRYAMVQRGVAVGIKLLKDVFEALSMHTPCIFLMEDIHVIGERRPFLIDEASSNSIESPYNKNQSMQALFLKQKSSASRESLYKNNKHLLSHYKKPYKEVKELAPNHFCFTLLFGEMLTKNRPNEIQISSDLTTQILKKQNQSSFDSTKSQLNHESSTLENSIYSSTLAIQSSKNEKNAPPASSPFNVLISNETTNLKHKKPVKQMPWFGLPGEQLSLVSKYNYSIRVKVALLADLVLSNLSVKLDMITDLLVIIDSVKSNRGFAVFATTHMPYILDPALRRPGRFDETISLPLIPGLYSRWSNYRSNIQYLRSSLFNQYSVPFNSLLNKGISLDLTNSSLVSNSFNQSSPMNQLIKSIHNSKSPISVTPLTIFNSKNSQRSDFTNSINTSWKYFIPTLRKSKSDLNKQTKTLTIYSTNSKVSSIINSASNYSKSLNNFRQIKTRKFETKITKQNYKHALTRRVIQLKSENYSYACKSLLSLFIYSSKASQKDLLNLKQNQTGFALKWPNLLKDFDSSFQDYSIYLTLFNSDKLMFKLILMSLIGVKVGEDFSNDFDLKASHRNLGSNRIHGAFLFNFDKAWKYGSSLLLNYIQKRQSSSLTKNLAFWTSNLISFNNKYSLMEPPSPPISNILLPTKRYENYKRSFHNQYNTLTEQHNFSGSISEKLQFHQQQRLLKRLYKYPIKQFFRSHLLKKDNDFTNFNNSFLTLAPLEQNKFCSINKLSSVNWCYRNILYNRHKTYLTNQWWNGFQGEHNAEATFLSDIDWRYTFVDGIGDIQIDFPDSEQFYNPRNRRWILTKGDWNYWFNIQSEVKQVYSHYMYESFTAAYKYLDKNREVLDFYVEFLHQSSLPDNLNDRNLLNLSKRFGL